MTKNYSRIDIDGPGTPLTMADFPLAADGVLFVFRGTGNKWSYAEMDDEGRVTQVREKVAISPFASTGTYYFRSSVQLVELIQQAMSRQETVNGEYYIGPLYNIMAAQGQPIKGVEVERFISFGTPEDLQASEASAANADCIKRLADRIAKYSNES